MANVYIQTPLGFTKVGYSVVTGRVRKFILHAVVLYDKSSGVAVDGWQDKLVKLVQDTGLDIDSDGYGLHKFVQRMQEEGLLSTRSA